MRAVLDVNVIVSALLAPRGAPAQLVLAWQRGEFDLIVSPLLLAELQRALGYPKLAKRVDPGEVERVVAWLRGSAVMAEDPAPAPAARSVDLGDEYLIALAASERAMLVSGDRHLLDLAGSIPICSPADFLRQLAESPP